MFTVDVKQQYNNLATRNIKCSRVIMFKNDVSFKEKVIYNKQNIKTLTCTTFHRYPIFSTRYSVMCKVCTGYCGTSEIEHGLCACTVDNPLAKARGLSLRTGAQPMLYLPLDLTHCITPRGYFDLEISSRRDTLR